MTHKPNAKGIVPPDDVIAAVAALVKAEGECSVASRLGVSVQTLARVGSGMTVNRTTILAVRVGLGLKEAS